MFNSVSNIAYVDNIMPVTLELKNIVTPQKTKCPTENKLLLTGTHCTPSWKS